VLTLIRKFPCITGSLLFISQILCYAGPPFSTDDPIPVDYKHWEYYISTINTIQTHNWTGTSPHFEVNYGPIPNVQLHLLLPMNYNYIRNEGLTFGYADTEFGFKYRFVQETENLPQIGIFPIIEIPTIKNNTFGNGKAQIYLPLWIQKSWGDLTTYGGAGYWMNPGANNKNWLFSGWEVQYDFSSLITLGGEVYYHTADTTDGKSLTAFNLGGFINFTEKFHLIFSVGHSITNENSFNSYIGVLWTI
jgi:hypothetical protein